MAKIKRQAIGQQEGGDTSNPDAEGYTPSEAKNALSGFTFSTCGPGSFLLLLLTLLVLPCTGTSPHWGDV
jgi:hypothetical protein